MANTLRTSNMQKALARAQKDYLHYYVTGNVNEGREVWSYCPHCNGKSPITKGTISPITCKKCTNKYLGWI